MSTATAGTPVESAWAPFRVPIYRALWIAQFTSNVGR
jgi:hypothetical protein